MVSESNNDQSMLDKDPADEPSSEVKGPVDTRQEKLDAFYVQHEQSIAEEILEGGGTVDPLHDEEEDKDKEKAAAILEANNTTEPKENEQQPESKTLSDYVTDVDGVPSLKMVVDGETSYVPLEQVRANQQKGVAAENRMREATTLESNLTERESVLRQKEAAYETRDVKESLLPDEGADDQNGSKEVAQSFVQEILHGDPDVATEKLASALDDRISSTSVDSTAIAKEVAKTVRGEIVEEDLKEAIATGWKDFSDEYADLLGDPNLKAVANNKTKAIANEHKDWSPSQVMLEAGRQTREWRDGHGDKKPILDVDLDTNDRQTQKDVLVPIVPVRTAAQQPEPEDEPQTSTEILNEIREQRGQV